MSSRITAPRQDGYPTSLWRTGETILEEHTLYFSESVSPSPLDLYVGLFAPGAVVRVPAFDAQGHPMLNDEVRLAEGLPFP